MSYIVSDEANAYLPANYERHFFVSFLGSLLQHIKDPEKKLPGTPPPPPYLVGKCEIM